MLSEIQSLDIHGDINRELLYSLVKSDSSETNLELFSILQNFQKYTDFFEYYTKINNTSVNNSLQELENNLSSLLEIKKEENEKDNDINQYLSSISNIILAFNIFIQIQNILKKIINSGKNNLNNCKIKNVNFQNLNSLFSSIENFNNSINPKDSDPKFLCTLPTNSASTDNTPKNILNLKNENFFFQETTTPRFAKDFEERKNSSDLNFDSINRDSELTLFNMKFSYKDFSNKFLQKKSNSGIIDKINRTYEKNEKAETEIYMKLLIFINESYKLCLINAEEKIRFKRLIISRFEKVKKIYFEYYDYLQTDKKAFIEQLKKLYK